MSGSALDASVQSPKKGRGKKRQVPGWPRRFEKGRGGGRRVSSVGGRVICRCTGSVPKKGGGNGQVHGFEGSLKKRREEEE